MGHFQSITVKNKNQTKPHKIEQSIANNNKIELLINFQSHIWLNEQEKIDELFQYYKEIENYLNENIEKMWKSTALG